MTSRTILLIDDEDDIREVASLTLETMGDYEVMDSGDGRSGIRKATERQPDVILLDVMMPDFDGPSTLAELRASEATRDIPVIFLTAKVQAADRKYLSDLGACGILAKPFNPLTLASEIDAILDGARA